MPASTLAALLTSLLTALSVADAPPTQRAIEIDFHDPFGRSSYQFSLSEGAYVAVFEVGQRRATLIFPAIGDELRRLRFGLAQTLPEPDNWYEEGRHLLPRRAGRVWSGTTENGFLMKGDHILVVASRQPFRFEHLNDLYVGEGEILRPRNSFGAPDDFTERLLRAIVPNIEAQEWAAYLHWIRLDAETRPPR